MWPIRESKWCSIMDIRAMSSDTERKPKRRMNGCPVFWNLKGQPKNTERTWRAYSKDI
jgi:hypothetical protein